MYRKALDHFERVDPIMWNLAKKAGEIKVEQSPDLFVSLTREIIGQQLSGRAAETIFGRFKSLFTDEKITPDDTLKLSDDDIRNVGAAWAKVRSIKDLAEKIHSNELDFEKIKTLDNEGVILELTKVKGIGPWTAEMFLMFALGREDIFSPGDLGLRKGIEKFYSTPRENPELVEWTNRGKKRFSLRSEVQLEKLEGSYNIKPLTPQQLLDISHKWSPYRTYASVALWRNVDTKPIV